MEINITKNAVNQVSKGTVIHKMNDEVDVICLILKGRVQVTTNGSKIIMGSGNFMGLSDFYMNRFLGTYTAYDDVTFYCFSLEQQEEELDIPFLHNNDYRGLSVSSLVKYINDINSIYHNLTVRAKQLYDFVSSNYEEYISLTKRLGYETQNISGLSNVEEYTTEFVLETKKYLYYNDLGKFTQEQWKTYCSVGTALTPYMLEEISGDITSITLELSDLADYIASLVPFLISQSGNCLFKNYSTLAIKVDENGGANKELINKLDTIVEQINLTEKLFEEKVGQDIYVDRKKMEDIYYLLLSKNGNRKEQVDTNFRFSMDEQNLVDNELDNSLEQILSYSSVNEDISKNIHKLLGDFRNLRDKNSLDDSVRALRKRITEVYYTIYELAFFRSVNDMNTPKAVELFLRYGLLDDTFLTKEQLRELYYLSDEMKDKQYSHVYNIYDWLLLIFQGKKEPSKNEFDMDYGDTLRHKRKRGEINEAEEKVLAVDTTSKVSYEIHNMFRYNNRLVNGQISTFIPFLYGENIIQNLKKLQVTSDRINQAIAEIIAVDYTLFYREEMYINEANKIQKEYIMEEYYPEIILLPTVGTNGIMWQDITGKRKSSNGRFILPTFSDVQLKDILIKICGRFRWELCRSIQGTAWNNIKYKSLTSEYSDYIQFYRKNKDISPEVKEKVKLQVQKGKGNLREIFVLDYETWIKNESSGAIRLNRVAREIIATYCPFKKSIRERLQNQPIFVDAMARHQREAYKKAKEIELRYRALEKEGATITKELQSTLEFYKER